MSPERWVLHLDLDQFIGRKCSAVWNWPPGPWWVGGIGDPTQRAVMSLRRPESDAIIDRAERSWDERDTAGTPSFPGDRSVDRGSSGS